MTLIKKKFKNTAKKVEPSERYRNSYGFDKVPILLFQWSRLFQAMISQAGTYLLTGKFHNKQCGIYKCEGGCNIVGVGEFVPCGHGCYFDSYYSQGRKKEEEAKKLSEIITAVVLGWDPNDPIESMLKVTADYIDVDSEELRKVVFGSDIGSVFGGNSLSSFFDWNPFDDPPYNEAYRHFSMVEILGCDAKEVKQMFADEKLGKQLKEQINDKIREANPGMYLNAMCCSPRRNKEKDMLAFWINTGRSTQIDGLKTEDNIKAFLSSNGVLVDKAGC